MVSIDKVINVKFNIVQSQSVLGTYPAALYITPHANTGYKVFSNIEEINADYAASGAGNLSIKENASRYFKQGGNELILYKPVLPEEGNVKPKDFVKALLEIKQQCIASNNNFILCVISNEVFADAKFPATTIADICEELQNLNAPYTMRIALSLPEDTEIDGTTEAEFNSQVNELYGDISKYPVFIKYKCFETLEAEIDSALSYAAYLTQLDLNAAESVKDYCYTEEGNFFDLDNLANPTSIEYDQMVGTANFTDIIGNQILNFGGNLFNGVPAVSDYVNVCAENDVVSVVLEGMLKKQYLTDSGLSTMVSLINKALNRYTVNGFLNVGSVYSGDTFKYKYGTKQFTIIEKNEVLPNGFYVYSIPIANLTVEDRQLKQFTPIIVVMETMSGARKIIITGETVV